VRARAAREKDAPGLVCLWATRWHGLWQRHQQLMSRLAASRRVLYVESPRDPWSAARALGRGQVPACGPRRPRGAAGDLYLFAPVVPFSLRRYPRLARVHQALLAPRLRRMLAGLRMGRPVLWVCYPAAEALVGRLGESFACYDCCDDLLDQPGPLAAVIREQERRLLGKVGAVAATSEPLRDRLATVHPRVRLIPNGADVEHFAAGGDGPEPPELAALPRPRLGFVGAIHHWVDVPLIARLAAARPDWSLVLIGGAHADVSALRGLPNVHLLGPRPYAALPAYVRRFDVCLVPFTGTPIARAADPIKVYEYLAAGKPVVASPLPRLRAFGGAVRLAAGAGEFAAQIARALEERGDAEAAARAALAAQHSWDARVRAVRALLGEDDS